MSQYLYISEYADVGHISGAIPTGTEPANVNSSGASVDQTVTVPGTSNALQPFTKMVRLHLDNGLTTGASILFGTNPTATLSNKRLAPNQTEYFTISDAFQGSNRSQLKISAIVANN
jgi:hypothetical protein